MPVRATTLSSCIPRWSNCRRSNREAASPRGRYRIEPFAPPPVRRTDPRRRTAGRTPGGGRFRPGRACWRPTTWRCAGIVRWCSNGATPVKERVPAIREFDRGGTIRPREQLPVWRRGRGDVQRRQAHLPHERAAMSTGCSSGSSTAAASRRFVYEHRPHLGSNRLPMLVRNFRRKIEALGGEYRFRCRVEDLDLVDGRDAGRAHLQRLHAASVGRAGDRPQRPRHLRDAAPRACRCVAKAFQLGLRIEQPQEQVNRTNTAATAISRSWAPPTTRWSRAASPICSRSACAPAGSSFPASRKPEHVLHQRHEQLAARHAVRQQRRWW